jgi:ribosome maturation factor RimP
LALLLQSKYPVKRGLQPTFRCFLATIWRGVVMDDVMIPVVEPLLAQFDLELVDFDRSPQIIRITVDRDGGVDLDTIAKATRVISDRFDELDIGIGRYTLEISSPGVERRLRTPAHFVRSLGENVSLKLSAESPVRRLDGVLREANDRDIVVQIESGEAVTVSIATIDKARTVFNWGSPAKPSPSKGKPKPKTKIATPPQGDGAVAPSMTNHEPEEKETTR